MQMVIGGLFFLTFQFLVQYNDVLLQKAAIDYLPTKYIYNTGLLVTVV